MWMSSRKYNYRDVIHPAVRVVGNVSASIDEHTQKIIDLGGLPILCSLLTHQANNVKKEACWTLSNITAGSIEQKQVGVSHALLTKLSLGSNR